MPGTTRELTYKLLVEVDKTASGKAQAELNKLRGGPSAYTMAAAAAVSNPALGIGRATTMPGAGTPVPVIIVGVKAGVNLPGMGGGVGGGPGGGPQAETANKTLEVLRNLQLGGLVGRYGQFKGYGDAAGALGFKGLGGAIGRVAGPAAALVGGAVAAGNIADALNTPYTTGALASRKLFRDLVPGGSFVQGISDQLTGRAAGIEQAQIAGQKRNMQIAAAFQYEGVETDQGARAAGYAARAQNVRPVYEGYVSRSTASGERDFSQKQRLLALDREAAELDTRRKSATAERSALETKLVDLQKRAQTALGSLPEPFARGQGPKRTGVPMLDAYTSIFDIAARPRDPKAGPAYHSGPAWQQFLEAQGNTLSSLGANANLQQSTAASLNQSRMQEAQYAAELRKNQARVLDLRAQFKEEDASTAAGTAARLGRMSPLQRAQAAAAAADVKKYGYDNVSEETRQLFETFAPREAQKLAEQNGARSREFMAEAAKGSADFLGDPERLRQEASGLRNEAEEAKAEAEKELASSFEKFVTDLIVALKNVIDLNANRVQREFENNMKSGRNVAG